MTKKYMKSSKPFILVYEDGQLPSSIREVSKAWEVLLRCFPTIQQTGFNPRDINHLSNGMVLRSWVKTAIGEFTISLKPTDIPHVYDVEIFGRFDKYERPQFPDQVDFRKFETNVEDVLSCHLDLWAYNSPEIQSNYEFI